MHVVLLGTAAGGGFPQWNCWCPPCRTARHDPASARPRTQSSAAVSADGERWFLLNASPDVAVQIGRLSELVGHVSHRIGHMPEAARRDSERWSPIHGVVFTDAELDHTIGVALLRESRHLPVYATGAVARILEEDSRLLAVTRAFADVPLTALHPGREIELCTRQGQRSGLSVMPFEVPGGPPAFARAEERGHTVGLLVRDHDTGGLLAYVPGAGGLDAALLDRLASADLLLFDGTFWTDDELVALGLSGRTARQMDHLPVSGADGSLALLSRLGCRYRVYTHINNTNPMLLEQGPERAMVNAAGLVVGEDGMHFVL